MRLPEPSVPVDESHETRLRRLKMRSWRRGIKEMDLILGSFADAQLAQLEGETLDLYDALLSENDQELYAWVTGQTPAAPPFEGLISMIAEHAKAMN